MSNYSFQNLRNSNTDNKKSLIIIAFLMLFLTVWNAFTAPSEEEIKRRQEMIKTERVNSQKQQIVGTEEQQIKSRGKKEMFLNNSDVKVGIDVLNNKITFLELKKYKQHEKSEKNVVLLDDDHFIENGWLGVYRNNEVNWKVGKKSERMISVVGDKNGIIFETIYTLDDSYGISIKQRVTNNSDVAVDVSSYGRVFSKDTIDRIENSYAFRGILIMNDGKIDEIKYNKVKKQSIEKNTNSSGWIGISDQYWITSLVSNENLNTTYGARYNESKNSYQIDFAKSMQRLKQGDTLVTESIAFVAPKKLELLNEFGKKYNVEKIDKSIDFGLFYFLSKPLLIILKRLYSLTGNFGIAIILLTILVRMIIFPLANRSYKVMAKMKKISPQIRALQEQYKDDKKALQFSTYELYKKQRINPMSAVIPLFIQIPIFFALYKVLIISIEMRDAPFFGWIVDLSSRDPSSLFNLFGLLNFDVPSVLQIGVLPLIMGFTMWLQQIIQPMNVNIDPSQQKIMKWFPVILTIMFASMPAGLVLYWSCSNIFTIIQQTIILEVLNRDSKE